MRNGAKESEPGTASGTRAGIRASVHRASARLLYSRLRRDETRQRRIYGGLGVIRKIFS